MRESLLWVSVGLILLVLLVSYARWLRERDVSPESVLAVALVIVTAWYGYATHRIASANAELAAETKAMAEETAHLSATARHTYLIQAIPVVALSRFEPREERVRSVDPKGPQLEPRGVWVGIKNVGGAPAIITAIVLDVQGIGGGGQILRTAPTDVTAGIPPPPYSLGPGDHWDFFADTNPDTLSLNPERSRCEIKYTDAFGNQFVTRHSPTRPAAIAYLGGPDEQLPPSSLGIPLAQLRFDATTGRMSAQTR